jgi:hypothetical protein
MNKVVDMFYFDPATTYAKPRPIPTMAGFDFSNFPIKVPRNNITTSYTYGLELSNNTASVVGTPNQYPPSLNFLGHVFNTTTSLDETQEWRCGMRTISGLTPSSIFYLRYSANGGAEDECMTLSTLATGSNGFGFNALSSNTGSYCNAVGYQALSSNTGSYCNAVGYQALSSNTGSSCNAVGHYALSSNTGSSCNAVGYYALYSNTGSSCNAVGYAALYFNTGASCNAVGHYALYSNTGSYCNAVGHQALSSNTGSSCNAVGYYALYSNTGSSCNAVGYQALWKNNWGSVINIGYQSTTYFLANAATDKTFTDAEITANKITFTAPHGFGTIGTKVNLKFTTTAGTPPTGLVSGTIYQFTITSNVIMTLSGIGTNASVDFEGKLTNSVDITNSIAIGADVNAQKANQIILGNMLNTETMLTGYIVNNRNSTDALGSQFNWYKSRNTYTAKTICVSGDVAGQVSGWHYDGANDLETSRVVLSSYSASIGATRIGGVYEVWLRPDSAGGSLTKVFDISSAGKATVKGFCASVVIKAFADTGYTVLDSDYTISCNAVGGEITINLPDASGSGRILNICKIDASANNVVVDGNSTDKIDADETKTISSQWSNLQIQDIADGQWKIL